MFSDVQSKNNAVPVLLSPSISPNSETNPSFRVYLFTNEMENNIKKLNLVDYVEYYTDFLNPKTKATGELIWKLEYDFNIAYNQTRVDAPALLDLLRQLRCVIYKSKLTFDLERILLCMQFGEPVVTACLTLSALPTSALLSILDKKIF